MKQNDQSQKSQKFYQHLLLAGIMVALPTFLVFGLGIGGQSWFGLIGKIGIFATSPIMVIAGKSWLKQVIPDLKKIMDFIRRINVSPPDIDPQVITNIKALQKKLGYNSSTPLGKKFNVLRLEADPKLNSELLAYQQSALTELENTWDKNERSLIEQKILTKLSNQFVYYRFRKVVSYAIVFSYIALLSFNLPISLSICALATVISATVGLYCIGNYELLKQQYYKTNTDKKLPKVNKNEDELELSGSENILANLLRLQREMYIPESGKPKKNVISWQHQALKKLKAANVEDRPQLLVDLHAQGLKKFPIDI